ncbi:SAM-dependent methyltransferase [Hoeflea olei]|uniref:SAM-dependent methyltransferase n=2 Tax=Hoeflea olei TaxID=1480615 RepID=A0A1C1YV03_9HYPH|nr:SAM-dependent methyltransferase [Hoeflea olei]
MWDRKYDRADYVYGTAPSRFLLEQAQWLTPGLRALSLADGEGRNSVFLAQQGLDVTAVDSSGVALAKARRLAGARSVPVTFIHADLREWDWQPESYDLVVAIFIQFAEPALRDRIFKGMRRTLKPGGVLLLHGYTPRQLDFGTGGPSDAALLYTVEMLAEAFDGMAIERLEAYEAEIDEGIGHSGRSALIDLVARKPVG